MGVNDPIGLALLAPASLPVVAITGPGVGPTANWAPTGYDANTSFLDVTTNGVGANVVSGLTGGRADRLIYIFNRGTQTLTLNHNDVASSAGNRFFFPGAANWSVLAYATAVLRYDSAIAFWTIFSRGM